MAIKQAYATSRSAFGSGSVCRRWGTQVREVCSLLQTESDIAVTRYRGGR